MKFLLSLSESHKFHRTTIKCNPKPTQENSTQEPKDGAKRRKTSEEKKSARRSRIEYEKEHIPDRTTFKPPARGVPVSAPGSPVWSDLLVLNGCRSLRRLPDRLFLDKKQLKKNKEIQRTRI